MTDARISFDEATQSFREFLRSQDWSDDLLWLSRDRLTQHRTTYWVYRPEELSSDCESRQFYEAARKTASSIRLDALGQVGRRTVCYVEDYGGDGHHLNYGVPLPLRTLRVVSNRLVWSLLKILNRIRGKGSGLEYIKIPEATG